MIEMKTRFVSWFLILIGCCVSAHAQWPRREAPNIPRTAEGNPNFSADAPRGPDGKPDLSGIWMPEFQDGKPRYLVNFAIDLKPEDVPLRPPAAALYKQRMSDLSKDDPIARCQPVGVPRLDGFPSPYKIIQNPQLTLILYEYETIFRQIFTDGRELPIDPQPTWMGYSVGKWEGDTFVVETSGFNNTSWLDVNGLPHSAALRVTERFRRINFGQLEIQITIDDPQSYKEPWNVVQKPHLLPNAELMESFCSENEKDTGHFVR
jgi:hypothetical protein